MDASLAVRALVQHGGMQLLYVDIGDGGAPEPALAMRTWEDGVAILPANIMCRCDGPRQPEHFGLIIETRALHTIAERAGVTVPLFDGRHKDGIADVQLRAVMDSLERELVRGGFASGLYMDALLAQLIVLLFRAFDAPVAIPELPAVAPPSLDPRVERVLRYIDEHLDADLDVDTIASVIDLSPFHFSRAFKRWTGETPHRYLLQRRLDRAQMLVMTSQMPFAQIARSLGFYDQSHFGHHFKRQFGTTPREMRGRKNVPVR